MLVKKIKILFPFFVIFSSLIYPQSSNDVDIIGIINDRGTPVIITSSGYFKLKTSGNNEKWLEYYRKIYNDSTITNPNTELKDNFNIYLVPFIQSTSGNLQWYDFDNPVRFNLFFRLEENNK